MLGGWSFRSVTPCPMGGTAMIMGLAAPAFCAMWLADDLAGFACP
jgi:hypothetical protein